MMSRRGLLLSAGCTALAGRSKAAPTAANWSTASARLAAAYPARGPGAFAIVAEGDRTLFARGFGLADLEQERAFAKNSVVRIASLTKQFTAVAVLRLVHDRRLDLDEALARRWPACPATWRVITLRQLLGHISGITDDLSPLYRLIRTDMTVDQILALYAGRALLSKPGVHWRYSNVNYWILGKIIEIVGEQPYADFVARHVLSSSMRHTRYGSHDTIIVGRAAGYEPAANGGWINARYFSPTLGYSAGGFLSTPSDMAAWYAALGRGEIVSPDMITLALTPDKTADGTPTGYGLGWYVSSLGGVTIAHHGGSTFGFESSVYWARARRMFAGVFKNTSDKRGEPDDDARILLNAAMAR